MSVLRLTNMITFYPGPSKIYPQITNYLQDAVAEGILSVNHRSEPFMRLLEDTAAKLRQRLYIPANYRIYLTSSATECWEIVAQSLTAQYSTHVYNGAFGSKWAEYTERLGKTVVRQPFEMNKLPDFAGVRPQEVVCLTHNETSNGTMLAAWPHLGDETLVAVDATSSMAGVVLDWSMADVWFASVQKCFGLPAGLAVMVCSPKALRRAEAIGERNHYNSVLFMDENFAQFQTHYTPNVLGIYLLNRVLAQIPDIQTTATQLNQRAKDFYDFVEQQTHYQLLVENAAVRSPTVLALKCEASDLKLLKNRAQQAGIVLGNGYGAWKNDTFRIANFPAITNADFELLKTLLCI